MEPRRLVTERLGLPGGTLGYRLFVPREPAGSPLLVTVHGDARRSGQQFRAFLPAAMALNVPLLAPSFDGERFPGYQRLAGAAGPSAALDALVSLIDLVGTSQGIATSQVNLFGFSGGAQFVHRAALRRPDRVDRLVVASAGWYTWLDDRRRFPHGLGAAHGAPSIDPAGFLGVPTLVLAGERDVGRDQNLRTTASLDRRQGTTRLHRALAWTDHLEERARAARLPSRVQFDVLEDCGHSFADAARRAGLVERVLEFLMPTPQAQVSEEVVTR